jgi:hypothetical protein
MLELFGIDCALPKRIATQQGLQLSQVQKLGGAVA